jgi:hypothetical protein
MKDRDTIEKGNISAETKRGVQGPTAQLLGNIFVPKDTFMDLAIKEKFIESRAITFPGSELPIACLYSDELNGAGFLKRPGPIKGVILAFSANWHRCVEGNQRLSTRTTLDAGMLELH